MIAACGATPTERPYRLPYADGVQVKIAADDGDHVNPPARMFDLAAAEPDQDIVAAAPGWVRFTKDTGDSSATTNNYVWIEHPLDYCQPAGGGPPGGLASNCQNCRAGLGLCNEWTMYVHMRMGSVEEKGIDVGDWVSEGQPIGVEGDVGCVMIGPTCGYHVHFAVWSFGVETNLDAPSENGDYEDFVEIYGRPERVPLFCTAAGLRLVQTGQTHFAGPCLPL